MVSLNPAHLASKFDSIAKQFDGLPPSTVMRLLVCDILERTVKENVEAIERQIRRPSAAEKPELSGRMNLNATSRSGRK